MRFLRRLCERRRPRRDLEGDISGVAAVEFALVIPILLLFIMGAIEIGYRIYAITIVNGAVREAARMASTGSFTGVQIDQHVTNNIRTFRGGATVEIEKRGYSDFTGVGLPEPITSGSYESGTYCYQDINNTGSWEDDRGVDGLGGPEDIVYYEVTMTYPTLMGFTQRLFNWPDMNRVTENTIVSNEPFAPAVRTPPATRCVP